MRFVRVVRAAVAATLLAAGFGGCSNSSSTTPGTLPAFITLSISPNPVKSTPYSPAGPTYAANWSTSITESAGQGGTVQLVKATIFDEATGVALSTANYDEKDLVVFVGSARVEPKGVLVVPQQNTYVPSTPSPAASLTVTITFKDDNGLTQEHSILAKIE
jgi:hypothetical protein